MRGTCLPGGSGWQAGRLEEPMGWAVWGCSGPAWPGAQAPSAAVFGIRIGDARGPYCQASAGRLNFQRKLPLCHTTKPLSLLRPLTSDLGRLFAQGHCCGMPSTHKAPTPLAPHGPSGADVQGQGCWGGVTGQGCTVRLSVEPAVGLAQGASPSSEWQGSGGFAEPRPPRQSRTDLGAVQAQEEPNRSGGLLERPGRGFVSRSGLPSVLAPQACVL